MFIGNITINSFIVKLFYLYLFLNVMLCAKQRPLIGKITAIVIVSVKIFNADILYLKIC